MQNECPSKHECTWQTYINSLRKCFPACHGRQICFQFVYVEGNSLSLLQTISDIIWVGGTIADNLWLHTAVSYRNSRGLQHGLWFTPHPNWNLCSVVVNLQLELCMKNTCLIIFSDKEHLTRIYCIVWWCLWCYCSIILWRMWGKIIYFMTRKTLLLWLSWYFLHCFTYHGGSSMKSVCNSETCKCKAIGLHAFITCAYVNWILMNHVGWSDGQLVLEPFCSISRIGAGHIWCQYILIAYCNSPFPELNMLAQRPI